MPNFGARPDDRRHDAVGHIVEHRAKRRAATVDGAGVRGPQRVPHDAAHSVRADHEIGFGFAASRADRAVRGDPGDLDSSVDGAFGQRAEQRFEQIGAVHTGQWLAQRGVQFAVVPVHEDAAAPVAHGAGARWRYERADPFADAQFVERVQRVGPEPDARADAAHPLGPLQHADLPARFAQPDRRAQAADTGPDHDRRPTHEVPLLYRSRGYSTSVEDALG